MNKKTLIIAIIPSLLVVTLMVRTFLIDWVYVSTGTDRHAPEVHDGDKFLVCLVCHPKGGDYVVVDADDKLHFEKIVSKNDDGTSTVTSPEGSVTIGAQQVVGKVLK